MHWRMQHFESLSRKKYRITRIERFLSSFHFRSEYDKRNSIIAELTMLMFVYLFMVISVQVHSSVIYLKNERIILDIAIFPLCLGYGLICSLWGIYQWVIRLHTNMASKRSTTWCIKSAKENYFCRQYSGNMYGATSRLYDWWTLFCADIPLVLEGA